MASAGALPTVACVSQVTVTVAPEAPNEIDAAVSEPALAAPLPVPVAVQ